MDIRLSVYTHAFVRLVCGGQKVLFLRSCSPCFFSDWVSHFPETHQMAWVGLPERPSDMAVSASPGLRLQVWTVAVLCLLWVCLSTWVLGSESRSSGSCGKHFTTQRASSPAWVVDSFLMVDRKQRGRGQGPEMIFQRHTSSSCLLRPVPVSPFHLEVVLAAEDKACTVWSVGTFHV